MFRLFKAKINAKQTETLLSEKGKQANQSPSKRYELICTTLYYAAQTIGFTAFQRFQNGPKPPPASNMATCSSANCRPKLASPGKY